jgi:hypothetical protein
MIACRLSFVLFAAFLVSSCSFSSKATDWSQRVGLDKKPTTYINTTKIGLNLLVFVPFMGDMGISGMVRDMTAKVEEEKGDEVRITQGDSENYWYGWPPITWIVTPVISTVAAEYYPSEEQYKKDQQAIAETEEAGGTRRWYMPWTW